MTNGSFLHLIAQSIFIRLIFKLLSSHVYACVPSPPSLFSFETQRSREAKLLPLMRAYSLPPSLVMCELPFLPPSVKRVALRARLRRRPKRPSILCDGDL